MTGGQFGMTRAAAARAFGQIAGPNTWGGTQDFSGATVLGISGGSTAGRIIDPRTHGALFDNVADDAAAIQAALDAAAALVTLAGLSGNDDVAAVVQMPPGRAKISTALLLPPNVWLRGCGPSTTYLVYTPTTGSAVQLKTGTEMQTYLSDFGIIGNNSATAGALINITQTGGASILGDNRHVIHNVITVSGYDGIYTSAHSEARISQVTVQRPIRYGLDLNSTDMFVSDCTVGQPGHNGIRLNGANSRMWGCKVFGGVSTVGGTSGAFLIAGSGRHQVSNCEVQDHDGIGFTIGSTGNLISNCLVDSCSRYGFNVDSLGTFTKVTNCAVMHRAGAGFTPQAALRTVNVTGSSFDISYSDTSFKPLEVNGSLSGAANHYSIGNERGNQSVAYAASITPDPFLGGTVYVGALTGNLTIANPAPTTGGTSNVFHPDQRLKFVLTQDATGGRTVTFGSAYDVTGGALPTAASGVVDIEFAWDYTKWREVRRTPINAAAAFAKPAGNRVSGLGDSLMAGTTIPAGAGNVLGDSLMTYAVMAAGGQIVPLRNAGIGGQTSTQIIARLAAELAYGPDYMLGMMGANDPDAATTRANVITFVSQCRAAGTVPVLLTLPPTDVSPANKTRYAQHNAWLIAWCARNRVSLIDVTTALIDTATGGYASGFGEDTTHPTSSGRKLMGDAVASALVKLMAANPLPLVPYAAASTNLVVNNLFAGTTTPTSWSAPATSADYTVNALAPDSTIGAGNVASITVRDSLQAQFSQTLNSGFSVGDRLAYSVAIGNDGARVEPYLLFSGVGTYWYLGTSRTTSKGLLYGETIVPAGTTNILIRLSVTGVGSAKTGKFAQPTLVNLTTLDASLT